MSRTEEGRTLDAGALKALAHPLRVRILDLLGERGPQTASSLAALLGETSGATSYHLRALAAHALIHEVPGRGTARERWWEMQRGRLNFPGPDETTTPASRAAAQVVTSEFYRLRHETLMEYLNRSEADVPQEWREASLLLSARLNMTAAQTTELRDQLNEVIEAAIVKYRDQAGPGVRRVSLRTELFDLPVAPEAGATRIDEEEA